MRRRFDYQRLYVLRMINHHRQISLIAGRPRCVDPWEYAFSALAVANLGSRVVAPGCNGGADAR